MAFCITSPVNLLSDYCYFVIEGKMRVNPGAIVDTASWLSDALNNEAHVPNPTLRVVLMPGTSRVLPEGWYSSDTDTARSILRRLVYEYANWNNPQPGMEGEWFPFRLAFTTTMTGLSGESYEMVVEFALETRSYALKPGSQPSIPLIEVDELEIYLVEMGAGLAERKMEVPDYVVRIPLPDGEDNPPRLNGWYVTEPGDMFLRIAPGLMVKSAIVTDEDVQRAQNNPVAWAVRAAAQRGWKGKPLALIYRVPPRDVAGTQIVTAAGRFSGQLRRERVQPAGRLVVLSEPAVYLLSLESDSGVVPLNRPVQPVSREFLLDSDPPAGSVVVAYLAETQDCLYAGYTSHTNQFIPFLVRRDQGCRVHRENEQGSPVYVDPEDFLYRQGATIYLLPWAVARTENAGWQYRPDEWLRAETFWSSTASLLRHLVGLTPLEEALPSSFALPIGRVAGVAALPMYSLMPMDVRERGGGLVDAGSLEAEVRNALWDVSDWDGAFRSGAGHVVVTLPRWLLDPNHPRGGYTEQEVHDVVRKYLPAGVTFDIEFSGELI